MVAPQPCSKESCDGDEALACKNLGRLYQDGRGVPRDEGRARKLFEKACKGKAPGACERLADAAKR